MPAFPVSLPQAPLLGGFSHTERETVIRAPVSFGPPQTRQRFTAALQPISCTTKALTLAQKEALRTFFRVDLKGGALTFTWPALALHTGGGVANFEIVAPPEFTPLGLGMWRASLQLVRLP